MPVATQPAHLGDLLPRTIKWRHLIECAHAYINDVTVEHEIDEALQRLGLSPQAVCGGEGGGGVRRWWWHGGGMGGI